MWLSLSVTLLAGVAQADVACGGTDSKWLIRSGAYPNYQDAVMVCLARAFRTEGGDPFVMPTTYSIHGISSGVAMSSSGAPTTCPYLIYSFCTAPTTVSLELRGIIGYGYLLSQIHFDCSQLPNGVVLSGTVHRLTSYDDTEDFLQLTCTNTEVVGVRDATRAAGHPSTGRRTAGATGNTSTHFGAFESASGGSFASHSGVEDGTTDRSSRAAVELIRSSYGMASFILSIEGSYPYDELAFTPDGSTTLGISVDKVIIVDDPLPLDQPVAGCPLCVGLKASPLFGSVRLVYKYEKPADAPTCTHTCTSASSRAGEYCAGGATTLPGNATNATACVAGASGVVIVPCGVNVTNAEILCLPLPTAGELTQAGLDVTVGAVSRAAFSATTTAARSALTARRASDAVMAATLEVLRVLRESGLGYAVPATCGGCRYQPVTGTPTPYTALTSDGGVVVANETLTGCGLCAALVAGASGVGGVRADDVVPEYLSAQFVVCVGSTSDEQLACLGGARCNGVALSDACVVSGKETLCPTIDCRTPPSSGSKKGLLGLLGLLGLIPLLLCCAIIVCVCVACTRRRKAGGTLVPAVMAGGDSLVPWPAGPHPTAIVHDTHCFVTSIKPSTPSFPLTCQP